MEELLTVSQASKLLKVSPALLYRLAANRKIPAVHISSCVRFAPEELRAWVKSGGVSAVEQSLAE